MYMRVSWRRISVVSIAKIAVIVLVLVLVIVLEEFGAVQMACGCTIRCRSLICREHDHENEDDDEF